MLFSSRTFVMSGSLKFTGIVGAKQMIVPLNKALSLKGLEINHTLQSEENFIECYRSMKKANRIYGVIQLFKVLRSTR